MLMLRCGIGWYRQESLELKGGMAANAPFKHTQLNYTPISPLPLLEPDTQQPLANAKSGLLDSPEFHSLGRPAASSPSIWDFDAATLLNQQQQPAA